MLKRAMDSTEKILFHKEWLKNWKKDPFSVYPIYIEIATAGYCNHRCIFCAFDYLGYKKVKINPQILKERVSEMANLGVKAIQYAGEGEPLLHPDMVEIVVHTKNAGIEVAMLTNGVLLTKKFVDKALPTFSWFQVSLDAATAETHAKLHRAPLGHFTRILKNLDYAVKARNKRKLFCEIGVQMLLLPQNFHEAVHLAQILKNMGADYFTIKPYSHHPLSAHNREEIIENGFKYINLLNLEEEVKKIAGDKIGVDFRKTAMNEIETERSYDRCYATPTAWAYICANGDVYACSAYLGDERFLVGNINEQTFQEIWRGEKRKKLLEDMENYDAKKNCRRICRMNRTNITLFALRRREKTKIKRGSKPGRINFI